MTPHIAIIVLHYKNLVDTKACLRSLKKVDYDNFSVIVVNNDAPDHGKTLQHEFDDFITLMQNDENLGFAEGNNVGIRAALSDAKTDAVLILNNDTKVEPNFLSEMVNKLSPPLRGGAGGGADMVAPKMYRLADRYKIDNLGLTLMGSGLQFGRRREREKLFCPSGGCALYSRTMLTAVAWQQNNTHYYFDPAFFAYNEEVDLAWRARLQGFTVDYAGRAVVYHHGSAATGPMSDFAVYHTYRNLIWMHLKNMPASLLLWQSPWLAAGWLFLFAFYTLKGRPIIILSAFWDGLLGLRFMLKKRREVQGRRVISNKTVLSWFATGLFPRSYLK